MNANVDRIVTAIMRGDAILVTGAGFSRSLIDSNGDNLPVGKQLAKSIWPIAFGADEIDDTTLPDVYQAALSKSPTLLRQQLERHFQVDRNAVPERYKTWFSLPWYRIYTLNIDDGDEAVSETFTRSQLNIVSALSAKPGEARSDQLSVVHLNGRLAEFPRITFSPWDFADHTVNTEPWYQEFAADIATRPTIVIGSVLDEPPLWHFIRLREQKGSSKEVRPRSWLISPTLDRGRAAMLHELNFHHIQQTEEDFFQAVIAPRAKELVSIPRRSDGIGSERLLDAAEEIRSSPAGTADYLLGTAPTWGDVTRGYAAEFNFDKQLSEVIDGLTSGTISVRGSAGSGKSTSLMRAAAKLVADGNKVLWLGRENELSTSELRSAIVDQEPDYLFIDDLDRFGGHAAVLLKSLQRSDRALVVVTATRSARYFSLRYDSIMTFDADLEQTRLTDEDAEALLEQLSRGNRLGALLSKTHQERVLQLTRSDDRQLLVTLIEATSGEKFHERVADECRGLSGAELFVYGVACTASWADNKPLSAQNLIVAAGGQDRNANLTALHRLEASRLLVKHNTGFMVRHRVVAESAIDHFRDEGLIANWISGLIFLAASQYEVGKARSTRLGRMLIRVINHNNLRALVADDKAVANIYGEAEPWLRGDPHFWLQRGSYETDFGDLPTARNFLEQARALDPGDVLVETAWAQLQFKWALTNVNSAQASKRVDEALEILIPIMRRSDANSPHTFAVFLIYSFRWLKEAPLRTEERRRLRELILDLGEKGRLMHRTVADVQDNWEAARKWITTNPMIDIDIV